MQALRDEGRELNEIAIYGESAGGGLAAGAVLKMRDKPSKCRCCCLITDLHSYAPFPFALGPVMGRARDKIQSAKEPVQMQYHKPRMRKVRILATLGPASDTPEMIEKLFRAGADAFAAGQGPFEECLLPALRWMSWRAA